jgi:hypothetical protein
MNKVFNILFIGLFIGLFIYYKCDVVLPFIFISMLFLFVKIPIDTIKGYNKYLEDNNLDGQYNNFDNNFGNNFDTEWNNY